jgi:hypothetical protein
MEKTHLSDYIKNASNRYASPSDEFINKLNDSIEELDIDESLGLLEWLTHRVRELTKHELNR